MPTFLEIGKVSSLLGFFDTHFLWKKDGDELQFPMGKAMKSEKKIKSLGMFLPSEKPVGSTMKYGRYFEAVVTLPFAPDKRSIRLWLPPEYDEFPEARFPVLYMSDGQNLVDAAFSAYGDWHLDRVIHNLSKGEGLLPPILVGIDCPKVVVQRSNELNPPYETLWYLRRRERPNKPIGNLFVDYIANDLKPYIDSLLRTNQSLEYTGIGGSSMGGIMAFYAYLYRKEVFGFSLAFSIPFFFYTKGGWMKILSDLGLDPESNRKLAMYVGGEGFEKHFVRGSLRMVEYLRSIGYDEHNLEFYQNPELPHHEEAWARYSEPALRFWLKDLK